MSATTYDLATLEQIAGRVAVGEFTSAADHYKPDLWTWTLNLRDMPDAKFQEECRHQIYNSANVSRFRGNWDHEHFKATACYHEAKRRHHAAGHDEDCRGTTLYSAAHARVMRDHGYTPTPDGTCRCKGISR